MMRENPSSTPEAKIQHLGAAPEWSPVKPATVFRKLFESSGSNDFEAVADTLDEDCEWVFMPNRRATKGKKEAVELCMSRQLGSDKTPEIMFDFANSLWGVFEHMDRGVLTQELWALAAASGCQFPADPGALIGKPYEAPVCFVYSINAKGKIHLLHEYFNLESLMGRSK